MQMKWAGVTPAQYDELRKTVHWEGNIPKGAVFHVAAFNNGSIHVTDIWESENELNNFIQNRLMPEVIKAPSKQSFRKAFSQSIPEVSEQVTQFKEELNKLKKDIETPKSDTGINPIKK